MLPVRRKTPDDSLSAMRFNRSVGDERCRADIAQKMDDEVRTLEISDVEQTSFGKRRNT